MRRVQRRLGALAAGLAASAALTTPPAQAVPGGNAFTAVKQATAAYHDLARAASDGFGLFRDAAGIACIASAAGAMGEHYVHGGRVGDPAIVETAPEILVYLPAEDGSRRLVAVEYVVLAADWAAAGNAAPPRLFGHEFHFVPAGNRYGLPPFYELHAWIWQPNPAGALEDFNPRLSCP
jgi:hypothetical protein